MGIARVFNWPAADVAAIAALQTLGAAGSLALNGTLAVPSNNGLFVSLPNIQRTITIKSTNDLSGVNFTITGTLQGVVVSVTHAGPNNTTYTTTQLFDSITSVTADAAAAAVEIGTGATGQTAWYMFDPYAEVANLSIAVVRATTIDYTFQVTLDDPNVVASPNVFTPISAMTGATTSLLGNFTAPCLFCNVLIVSSSGSGALVATILQQGPAA